MSGEVAHLVLARGQAWQFDSSKARAQADFSWLDQPGVWQEIDSYMVGDSKHPTK